MSGNYLPNNDQQVDVWVTNFLAVLESHLAEVGLGEGDLETLDTVHGLFNAALLNHLIKQNEAISATALKSTRRKEMEDILRPLARRINHHPGMTDSLRGALGLKVPVGIRSVISPGTEIPGLVLEAMPGKIVVHFGTDPSNEQINGKPTWARGCNVYRKTAAEDAFHFAAFEMASPYIDNISGPASDYTYVVQYRGNRSNIIGGESSPMSIASSGRLAA